MIVFKIIFYYLIFINFYVFGLYFIDKRLAIKKKRRIPEKRLLRGAFLGGWLGGLLGMMINHHKTKKWYFYFVNILAMGLWIGVIYCWYKYN